MGFEPSELPGPARERRHALVGRKIEHDMTGRGVARPGVQGDVGVERATISRIGVDDLGADRDLAEVRRRDRAEVTGEALVLRALLGHVKISASGHGRPSPGWLFPRQPEDGTTLRPIHASC
jgi:hypothetical protein